MENMVSIHESRYIELLEIEKKYKADNFNNDTDNDTDNDKFRTLYAELKSTIDAGVSISAGTGNDSIWRRIYGKVFGLDSSICARWKELVPDFSWYDPDYTYYDDVIAFYQAVQEYMIQNGILSKDDI